MDNDLAAKRLAAFARVVTTRRAALRPLQRWSDARTALGFPTDESRAAQLAFRETAAEFSTALAEYVQLLDEE
jgi:hypothetical protein